MHTTVKSSIVRNETAAATKDIDIWHKRFGHANKRIVEEMKKEDLIIGMTQANKEKRQCEPCVEGKMCRKSHRKAAGRKTT